MDLAERLLTTLRDIANDAHQGKLDLRAAEQLHNMGLVEANNGTNYRLTPKGRQILGKGISAKH